MTNLIHAVKAYIALEGAAGFSSIHTTPIIEQLNDWGLELGGRGSNAELLVLHEPLTYDMIVTQHVHDSAPELTIRDVVDFYEGSVTARVLLLEDLKGDPKWPYKIVLERHELHKPATSVSVMEPRFAKYAHDAIKQEMRHLHSQIHRLAMEQSAMAQLAGRLAHLLS